MKKLLLCLMCLLISCVQKSSHKNLTKVDLSVKDSSCVTDYDSCVYDFVKGIEGGVFPDMVTLTGDSNTVFGLQKAFILRSVLDGNYDAADSWLRESILEACIDSITKANRLSDLSVRFLEEVDNKFILSEYQNGRKLLEYIQPYLPQNLITKWRENYLHSYLSDLKNDIYGDPDKLTILRKVLELSKQWDLQGYRTQALGSIGTIFANMSEMDSAYYYLDKAVHNGELYNIPNLSIEFLTKLAIISYEFADFDRFERATASADSLVGYIQDHIRQYHYYLFMSDLYFAQRNWHKFGCLLDKAEHWCVGLDIPQRYSYETMIYSRKAWVYLSNKDYNNAFVYAHNALKVWRQDTLKRTQQFHSLVDHPFYAMYGVHMCNGDSVRQYAYLDSLINFVNRPDVDPSLKQTVYELRAKVNLDRHDTINALKDYELSLQTTDQYFALKSYQRVSLLTDIGILKHKLGYTQKGLQDFMEAYKIAKSLPLNDDKSRLLISIAFCYTYLGEIGISYSYIEELGSELRSYIRKYQHIIDPIEALKVSLNVLNYSSAVIENYVQTYISNSPYSLFVYNYYLITSLWPMDIYRSGLTRVMQEGNEQNIEKYKEIVRLQTYLSRQENDVFLDSNQNHLSDRLETLKRALRSQSKAYGDLSRVADIDFKAIQKRLNRDEFLLNVIRLSDTDGNEKYKIFLVNSDQEYPIILSLPVPNKLDISLNLYELNSAKQFVESIWNPIAKHIPVGATVYYCSNESFSPLAIENIPLNDNTLLGEKFNFCRISSALWLFDREENLKALHNNLVQAVLYGGLTYDLTPEEKQLAELTYSDQSWIDMHLSASRGDTCFSYLPGTLKEVNVIRQVLLDAGVSTTVRKGSEGTEHSFISMSSHSPNILHLATHGYFTDWNNANRLGDNFNNPALWSGLVLSGGNEEWRDTTGMLVIRGGIVTSYEIAQLDLSNVDLLVLSACQTGKSLITEVGDIGLLGAFKSAGVKSVVMTLWDVSDRVTQEFMVKFYQELIDRKWNKLAAFEAAKAYIRNRYPEPQFWAGFVIVDAE